MLTGALTCVVVTKKAIVMSSKVFVGMLRLLHHANRVTINAFS